MHAFILNNSTAIKQELISTGLFHGSIPCVIDIPYSNNHIKRDIPIVINVKQNFFIMKIFSLSIIVF